MNYVDNGSRTIRIVFSPFLPDSAFSVSYSLCTFVHNLSSSSSSGDGNTISSKIDTGAVLAVSSRTSFIPLGKSFENSVNDLIAPYDSGVYFTPIERARFISRLERSERPVYSGIHVINYVGYDSKDSIFLEKSNASTRGPSHNGTFPAHSSFLQTPSTPACLLSAREAGWCGRYCQSGSTVPPGLPSARLKGLWPWRVFFRNRTRGDYMGRMHGKHAPGGLPCNSSHLRGHRGVQQNQGPARTSYSVANRKAQDCTSAALHPPASAARNTDSQSGYDDLSKSGNSCAITFASNALRCCPSERSARK